MIVQEEIQLIRIAMPINKSNAGFRPGAIILYIKCSHVHTTFWLMLDITKSWCGPGSAHWSLDSNVYSWRFMRAAATYK